MGRCWICGGGENMAYKHINSKGVDYYLHSREVNLRSGRKQVIYFFAKQTRSGAIDSLPEGFEVVENPRTGLPILRRKK